MEKINVSLEMTEDSLEDFAKKIYEHLSDIAVDDLKTAVIEDIDIKEDIESYMRYDFDITDHLDGVNWRDYLDSEELDSGEVESIGRSLLESYNPQASCSTGSAFTEAVAKAIRYLLFDNDYVHYIVKALERFERAKIKEELESQLKEKYWEQFKAELTALKDAEDKAKEQVYSSMINPYGNTQNGVQ